MLTAGTVRTTPVCGLRGDFVSPSFTPQTCDPWLYIINGLSDAVSGWRVADEGDTPSYLLSVPANSQASRFTHSSGLWFVANSTNHIQPIGDKCYYITEGCGSLYIRLGCRTLEAPITSKINFGIKHTFLCEFCAGLLTLNLRSCALFRCDAPVACSSIFSSLPFCTCFFNSHVVETHISDNSLEL